MKILSLLFLLFPNLSSLFAQQHITSAVWDETETITRFDSLDVPLIKQDTQDIPTAYGIERKKEALGYAVQQVKGEDIVRSAAGNTLDGLVGKAVGIQVTRSSGSVGAGSRIVLRGATSVLGNNQPLIVIDGVRTNNETLYSQPLFAGTASSNRLMDLAPEDIESVTVLRSAAATALYGTAGAAGAIIVATKKGRAGDGLEVSFSSSIGFDRVSHMIDLQNEYAQGAVGIYRGPSTGEGTSWGPSISDLEFATDPNHPNAPGAGAFDPSGNYLFDKNGFLVPKGTGNETPANRYDNVDPFFQTGTTWTHALALSGGNEMANFRFSVSDRRANGVVPNEAYDRTTVRLAGDVQPSDKLSFSGTAHYTKSYHTRIQQGSNLSGLMLGLLRTPVSFDNANGFDPKDAVNEPSAYQFSDFRQRNYRGGFGYDNPYWVVNNALGEENVDRVFGHVRAGYQLNDWFNFSLNIGADLTSDDRRQGFEIGSRAQPAGAVQHDAFTVRQFDHYLHLTGGGDLHEDIGLNYLLSANVFSFRNEWTQVTGEDLLSFGRVDTSNAVSIASFEKIDRYRSVGFAGRVEVNLRRWLYLTLGARQDYDSRFGDPADFKLQQTGELYPAASLSFVFSEIAGWQGLSFGQLRLAYARAGSPTPESYLTQSIFEPAVVGDNWTDPIQFPIGSIAGFDQSDRSGNPELRPEMSTTLEAGTAVRFFADRLGLDAAFYRTQTRDAILPAPVTPSSGFTSSWLNVGEMTSRGVELTLDVIPACTADFSWGIQINFSKSETVVGRVPPDQEGFLFAGNPGFPSVSLLEGQPYGVIVGGAFLRSEAGTATDRGVDIPGGPIVINDFPNSFNMGYPLVDPKLRVIGNPNPDFILGWHNTFSYKNFSFHFLLDWREGGDVWNGTLGALTFFGRTQQTADTREEAAAPIVGVKESDGSPNDIPVVRDERYWTSFIGGFGAVDEQFVQDGGWIRLREVGLEYQLPALGFLKGGSIGVAGRNLWLKTDYDGVDPETSLMGVGNGQGLAYFNMPGRRTVVVRVRVCF